MHGGPCRLATTAHTAEGFGGYANPISFTVFQELKAEICPSREAVPHTLRSVDGQGEHLVEVSGLSAGEILGCRCVSHESMSCTTFW